MAETTAEIGSAKRPEDDLAGMMTLREHLLELRKRLTIAALAIAISSFVAWPFKDQIFAVMASPLPANVGLQQITPTEGFFTFVKLSLLLGVGISSPIVMYQVLAFVAPGLYEHEKRWLYISIPAMAIMFLIGVFFAWFVVLRFTLGFLTQFTPASIKTELSVESHVTFVGKLVLAVGIVFETPFVIFLLAKLRIINAATLSRIRRYAIVVIVILAAVITPTPDPFTQMTVAIPMYLLYELGVLLARIAVPSVEPAQTQGSAAQT